MPLDNTVKLTDIAKKTEGYSGADIEGLLREAALITLKENKMKPSKITDMHMDKAMKKVRPSLSKEVNDSYEQFSKHYASFSPSYVR